MFSLFSAFAEILPAFCGLTKEEFQNVFPKLQSNGEISLLHGYGLPTLEQYKIKHDGKEDGYKEHCIAIIERVEKHREIEKKDPLLSESKENRSNNSKSLFHAMIRGLYNYSQQIELPKEVKEHAATMSKVEDKTEMSLPCKTTPDSGKSTMLLPDSPPIGLPGVLHSPTSSEITPDSAKLDFNATNSGFFLGHSKSKEGSLVQ